MLRRVKSSLSPAPVASLAAILCLCSLSCGGKGPTGPEPDPRLLWQFSVGGYDEGLGFYYSSPALSADESVVYIGTAGPMMAVSVGGFALYALDAVSGNEVWDYPLGDLEVRSTPAVAADGRIFFVACSREGAGLGTPLEWLYCLSSSGSLLWRYQTGSDRTDIAVGYSAPALASDGTVYVAGDSLIAVNHDGTLRWRAPFATDERLRNSPSVGSDGRIYFATHNLPLSALDPTDGSVIWQQPLGVNDHCFSPPALTPGGDIRIGNDEGVLWTFDHTGAPGWTFGLATDLLMPGYFRSSPALDADGTLYIGTKLSATISGLLAIGPDESLKWFFQPDDVPEGFPQNHGDVYSSPAIGADGTIFIGHEMGRLYALDSADGSMKWKFETQHAFTWSSPAIRSDGTLYIGDLDGNLYALITGCGGLKTTAPWPKFRHDNQNTGRQGP